MKKLYVCPTCGQEHSGIVSAWDYDGGDLFDDLIRVFHCPVCEEHFTDAEGFWGYEGQPDDNSDDDIPFGNPI